MGGPALAKARRATRLLPVLSWARSYPRTALPADLAAGVITAVLLIPQAMAYAALAGVPPEVGLYASILPPLIYAVFGTSRTLAVGPVSVAALLVANALADIPAAAGSPEYLAAVMLLAAWCGALLLAMGLLRMGALVHYVSHPVLSGFTSAAALIIILSQIGALTGIDLERGHDTADRLIALAGRFGESHAPTLLVGGASLAALLAARRPLQRLLTAVRLGRGTAGAISRAGPLAVVALATAAVATLGLHEQGVAVVGAFDAGLPPLGLSFLNVAQPTRLLPDAALIALIGYVESVSVAKVLAHRRRQRVDPNQELVALGLSNIGAAAGGGMPVAGGFSRSMVNFDAGARTQLAAVITAVLVAVAAVVLTPLFTHLPQATLAAIIVVAVSSLVNWREALATWRYDRGDFLALAVTFAGVLAAGLEWGLVMGLVLALGIQLWRSGHPHVAVVGRVPGTEHFRNVKRHRVETWPELVLLRVDESLFFANAGLLEDVVGETVADAPRARHLVLICSAVNRIDFSALETLEHLSSGLAEAGVQLHLAEVKGPVMDRLEAGGFCARFAGQIFLSTEQAVEALVSCSEGKV